MNITKIQIKNLNTEQKQQIYDMYVKTYEYGKQDIWFKTPERLFSKYPCLITVDNKYNKFYIMYQLMSNYNKISLIAHDLTPESIKELFSMLSYLLNDNGYIMEAAGAVSWKLRQLNTNYFNTKESIEKVLDINPNDEKSDKILINTKFLYNTNSYTNKADIDKQKMDMNLNYHYTRSHIDTKTGTIYTNNDTLFGNPNAICDFEGKLDCFRECKSLVNNNAENIQGGTRIGTKLRKTHKHNSRKNIKNKISKHLKKYKRSLKK